AGGRLLWMELLAVREPPVEGHPTHHLRVRKMAASPPDLPDPLVGVSPASRELLEDPRAERPRRRRRVETTPPSLVDRVHDFPVHIDLNLVRSPGPDPNRPAALE